MIQLSQNASVKCSIANLSNYILIWYIYDYEEG
jgi:hypothetical protein